MIRRARIGSRRIWRRAKSLLTRYVRATPGVRSGSPWVLAVALNVLFAAMLLLIPHAYPPRGTPEGENVVSIFVVPPPQPEPVPEPVPQVMPSRDAVIEPSVVDADDTSVPALPPPEVVEAAQPSPQPDTEIPDERGIQLPQIALPDADSGQGTPDGLAALNCYDQFSDPDKAAECAGREILSGWRASIDNIGSDWDEIAESLRRGGYDVPAYGPDPLAGMAPGTRVFEPQDPRFRAREFDSWGGGKYGNAFTSSKEYREYQALRDPRRYVGEGGGVVSGYGIGESVPLSGWQPSWQLRDDPNIDQRTIERVILLDEDE